MRYTTEEESNQREAIYPSVLILIYASLGNFSKQTTSRLLVLRHIMLITPHITTFTDLIRKLKCSAIKRGSCSYANINKKYSAEPLPNGRRAAQHAWKYHDVFSINYHQCLLSSTA